MNKTAQSEVEVEEMEEPMFRNTVAFSSYSVNDMKKAKEFYGQTLGLGLDDTKRGLELQLAGGGRVFLYPKENHVPATFTVLNFPVPHIEEAVAELVRRCVRF